MDRLTAHFKESPGYRYNVDQATQAANQAAAAGGMLGSPAEQTALARTVHGLADNDFQNYFRNVLGLYRGGLSGLGHFQDEGLHASDETAANYMGVGDSYFHQGDNVAQIRIAQAKAAEEAARAKKKEGSGWGSLLGGIAGAALGSALLPGVGTAIGGSLGSSIGGGIG